VNFQDDTRTYAENQADPTIGAIPLTAGSSSLLLAKIIEECPGTRLMFDLDSTLLNNRPRNAIIMQEFGQAAGIPLLACAKPEHFPNWSSRNSMALLGLSARDTNRILPQYESFWRERFFTSEYCQYDIAIDGASEFVSNVVEAGAEVTYLTGRHEAMRTGSVDSLAKLRFPKPGSSTGGSEVGLVMKSEYAESDDSYKENVLDNFQNGRPIGAAFDNEPSHINSYRRAYPDAVCIHLLTDHSMRDIRLLSGVISILNFARV